MVNSSRNLYPGLDGVRETCCGRWLLGSDLCPEAGQGAKQPVPRAAPCAREAGPLGSQTSLAGDWEVGPHLLFLQKRLLELIVLILFSYFCYFFSSLLGGWISAGGRSDVIPSADGDDEQRVVSFQIPLHCHLLQCFYHF